MHINQKVAVHVSFRQQLWRLRQNVIPAVLPTAHDNVWLVDQDDTEQAGEQPQEHNHGSSTPYEANELVAVWTTASPNLFFTSFCVLQLSSVAFLLPPSLANQHLVDHHQPSMQDLDTIYNKRVLHQFWGGLSSETRFCYKS